MKTKLRILTIGCAALCMLAGCSAQREEPTAVSEWEASAAASEPIPMPVSVPTTTVSVAALASSPKASPAPTPLRSGEAQPVRRDPADLMIEELDPDLHSGLYYMNNDNCVWGRLTSINCERS